MIYSNCPLFPWESVVRIENNDRILIEIPHVQGIIEPIVNRVKLYLFPLQSPFTPTPLYALASLKATTMSSKYFDYSTAFILECIGNGLICIQWDIQNSNYRISSGLP